MSEAAWQYAAVGAKRRWRSPVEQIEWLEQRVESMQTAMQKMHDDHVEELKCRLLEVKELHRANARHKRAVKSNQVRFHERDAKIEHLISTLELIADAGTARDNGWWFHDAAKNALQQLKDKEFS